MSIHVAFANAVILQNDVVFSGFNTNNLKKKTDESYSL